MNDNSLTRSPMRHGSTRFNSDYDFDTLIVRYADGLFPGKLSDWAPSSAAAHEGVHWNQHHATTIGAFLSGIRMAQGRLFGIAQQFLSPTVRQKFLRWRMEVGPMVQIDPETNNLLASSLDDDPMLEMIRSQWMVLQLTYTLFSDCDRLGSPFPLRPIDLALAVELVRCAYAGVIDGDIYLPQKESVQALEGAMTDSFNFIYSSDESLITTRNLLEAACLAVEAHHLEVDSWYSEVRFAFLPSAAEELDSRMMGGPVAKILTDFHDNVTAAGFVGARTQDLLRSFLLLAHVALNPPLPPFWNYAERPVPSVQMEELIPVNRFFALTRDILTIGLYRGELDGSAMTRYIEDACDAAGFVPLSRYAHQAEGWSDLDQAYLLSKVIPSDRMLEPEQLFLQMNQDVHESYLIWVQRNFWQHREDLLAHIIFGMGARHAGTVEHVHPWNLDPDGLWVEPLVRSWGENAVQARHPDLGLNVVASAAGAWAAWEIMVSPQISETAEIDIGAYPVALRSLVERALVVQLHAFTNSPADESD
jgi:hypothetical protein